MMRNAFAALALMLALSACGTQPSMPTNVKLGKPYNVNGITYSPQYDPQYDETGTASWYGPGFHGNRTANGERFDKSDLTAAHPTLPMPSMVRVTNLSNGKSIIVRINDRGPFASNRIIDLSHKAADKLDMIGTGTARVRVQYLKEETEQYWAQRKLNTDQISFAKNDPYAPDKNTQQASTVAADSEAPPQIKSAAPVITVSSNELRPEDLKIRPIQPRFRVIDDAQADETQTDLSRAMPVRRPDPPPTRVSASEKTVHLYDSGGQLVETQQTTTKTSVHQEPPEEVAAAPPETFTTPSVLTAPQPPPVTGGGWFVQAGSFASETNAASLAQRLQSVGSAIINPVERSGTTWHRVRVGPFSDHDAAQVALDAVRAQGLPDAKLVKND
jgi:rare lipoprotein A